ncbi:hypothetical protein LAY57_30525 [Argonema antarcticum A004/B2]|nr:hypothetical protein [Argonema antarcticum A004/B2]
MANKGRRLYFFVTKLSLVTRANKIVLCDMPYAGYAKAFWERWKCDMPYAGYAKAFWERWKCDDSHS